MPDRTSQDPGGSLRRIPPTAVVITFALVMTACVLGVVAWKAFEAKTTALKRGSSDIQNLAHSLAEHASHTIQAVDIAMDGMVDLLKYRDPLPDRFNKYLADTADTLPQIREFGVLDTGGNWRYSSLPETPRHSNADREYFAYHRDAPGKALRINEPFASSRGYITISAGVAVRTRSTLDEAALVGEADTALYEAKRLGRNRSILYSSLDLQYVDSASIQHDDEFAPGERTH